MLYVSKPNWPWSTMGSPAFGRSPWGKLELYLMRLKVCFWRQPGMQLCSFFCLLTEPLWIFWSNNQSNNANDLWLWAMIISRELWSIRPRNIRSAVFGTCSHRNLAKKKLDLYVSVKKLWRSSRSPVCFSETHYPSHLGIPIHRTQKKQPMIGLG